MTPKKASKMELSGNKLRSSSPPSEENRKGVGGSDKANIACLPSTHPLAFSGLCGDEYVTETNNFIPQEAKETKKGRKKKEVFRSGVANDKVENISFLISSTS